MCYAVFSLRHSIEAVLIVSLIEKYMDTKRKTCAVINYFEFWRFAPGWPNKL